MFCSIQSLSLQYMAESILTSTRCTQELDESYLVISDTFPGVPWRYTDTSGLINILSEKIDQGFTFPLNPKWILCDPGWKVVYDKLLASVKPNVQNSMDIWYPEEIRKRIDEISNKYPSGFIDTSKGSDQSSGVRADLAQLELKRFVVRLLLYIHIMILVINLQLNAISCDLYFFHFVCKDSEEVAQEINEGVIQTQYSVRIH